MNLDHLKYSCCPVCRAEVKSKIQQNRHTNGNWNEDIVFSCGASIRFSPNFMEERIIEICPKSKEYISINLKRNAARQLLGAFIKNLDVDEAFKSNLYHNIPGIEY